MHRLILAFIGLSAASGPALAQHAGDILLEQSGGRITTGLVDDVSGIVEHGVRVFAAEFGEAFPDFTNEPGFDSVEGAFPAGGVIGFNFRRALRVWDPVVKTFAAIPAERIQAQLASLGPVVTPVDDTPVAGFGLTVGATGEYHHHLGYTLLAPAGEGVYLLEMEMWTTIAGLGTSEPFWIVFNQNDTEEHHDEAIEWARDHLATVCRVDLNGDGVVDFGDYLEFLNLYDALDAAVDFNGDGVVDFGDYLEFLNLYEAGCP